VLANYFEISGQIKMTFYCHKGTKQESFTKLWCDKFIRALAVMPPGCQKIKEKYLKITFPNTGTFAYF
jgi:hypothetical protein